MDQTCTGSIRRFVLVGYEVARALIPLVRVAQRILARPAIPTSRHPPSLRSTRAHNNKTPGLTQPISLVFWVELGLGPVVVGSSGPRPGEAPARGYSKSGQILLRHSDKWYQSQMSENLENMSGVTW
jgi:hypothetical protein